MEDDRKVNQAYTENVHDLVRDIKGRVPLGNRTISKVPSIESLLDDAKKAPAQRVWKVVLTGGPCGGKTTSLSVLADKLMSHGFNVYTVPENATMFSTAGAGFPVNSNQEHQLTWETSRMIVQMQMEDSYEAIARASSQPTVILCDRGVVDARAYMDDATWQMVMQEMHWDDSAFIDQRYDIVIHMVTTAIGAPKYYVNTVYRHETAEQAAALDRRIQAAWKGHKKKIEIDNSTEYNEKVKRAWDTLCSGLGISVPSNSVTFQLSTDIMGTNFMRNIKHYELVQTTVVFLQKSASEENHSFVRTRKQNECFSFSLGTRTPDKYTERHISKNEFLTSLKLAHQQLDPIEFDKLLWIEKNSTGSYFFELSHHTSPFTSFCTLKIETSNTPVTSADSLPQWLQSYVIKDITKDPDWKLFELTKRLSLSRCPRCTRPQERADTAIMTCSCGCQWCIGCLGEVLSSEEGHVCARDRCTSPRKAAS
eukprot:TRINITY_DN4684_c0_g1_i1.p1 TRINITY_DN4684_c0_g1~~TRINITY_DN4684_c0_g1_i1.p1  ORF type:complete len:480 (+),score=125.06 TRINITY_DN4684_c0_g1_i1:44-1483(+)